MGIPGVCGWQRHLSGRLVMSSVGCDGSTLSNLVGAEQISLYIFYHNETEPGVTVRGVFGDLPLRLHQVQVDQVSVH